MKSACNGVFKKAVGSASAAVSLWGGVFCHYKETSDKKQYIKLPRNDSYRISLEEVFLPMYPYPYAGICPFLHR